MRLPFFSTEKKLWVGLLGILAFLIFYMLPNHVQFFTPMYLPMFEFEKNLPFIDWTIWFYISDYLFVAVVFILLKDRTNMNQIFYSQILVLIVSMLIFFLFPTAFPRPTVEYHGLSGAFVKLLHFADTPGNACPSIHIAVTFLAGFGFLREQKNKFWFFMLWAILISFSTLTVKQHYAIDVICGFFMAAMFYVFGMRFIREHGNTNIPK